IESTGIDVDHYSDSDFVLENTGTIEATINNKLDKNGYALDIDSYDYSNKVKTINSGTLRGNIEVDGLLENSGTIELAYNAMNYDNAYVQNFTNKEDGKLTIGLKTDGTLDGTEYSQLNTERAIFENGSTLDVNVLNTSTNQSLLAGKRLENVIYADTELTINGKLNVTDNSALLNFEYKTSDDWINGEDGAIHLVVVKSSNNNIVDNTISGGGNQNSQTAASALQTIQDNGNYPNMNRVFTSLNQLSSSEAVAKAVESTTPVATSATVGATTQISNGIAGIVTQRQNANISAGGMNSGDGMFSENNLWIKPFGSIGSQNDKDGINGFDVKTYGLGFGADTEYKDNQKVGLAFFYTNGNVDVNNMNQNANLDVFTTLIYGNVPVIDDKTNFLYQAGYAWQKTQTDRTVFTGDIAESKYTSKTASLDLKLMRDLNVNKDLLLQPLVNTTYRHFTNPAYNETGAGALNLNADKFTSSELIVGLGTLAHYKLTDDSKIVGNINVGYDLHDKNQTVTSSYEGAAGVKFGTDGIDNGRWSYEAGIGYEMDINKTNNINVSYDYQGQGSDFSNNVVSAKYVLKF
ncbi:MAG: autotransporter outer membrane beta-barrel domain-containing protein, partial [Arcobacter sp.]|nr:autotransporter outer membrane beta-barrel domain-containing protein [Arcobacter sp.]